MGFIITTEYILDNIGHKFLATATYKVFRNVFAYE